MFGGRWAATQQELSDHIKECGKNYENLHGLLRDMQNNNDRSYEKLVKRLDEMTKERKALFNRVFVTVVLGVIASALGTLRSHGALP